MVTTINYKGSHKKLMDKETKIQHKHYIYKKNNKSNSISI